MSPFVPLGVLVSVIRHVASAQAYTPKGESRHTCGLLVL